MKKFFQVKLSAISKCKKQGYMESRGASKCSIFPVVLLFFSQLRKWSTFDLVCLSNLRHVARPLCSADNRNITYRLILTILVDIMPDNTKKRHMIW